MANLFLITFAFLCGIGKLFPEIDGALLHTCNGNDLEKCAQSADSLLKDPNLVFPDSPASLDRVCRTWNDFTACIYDYTKNCFTQTEKLRFDEQFREPAMSMNTLCQDQAYRKEYFKVAPCIQKITTNEAFCGFQYRFLIDQISGSVVTMKQLCCAREKFRQCILQKTGNICAGEDKFFGRARPGALNSTTFAIQVLDKSLAFIAQQCSLPSIQNGECPGSETPEPFFNKGTRYDRPEPGGNNRTPSKDSSSSGAVVPNFVTGNINGNSNSNRSPSKTPEYKLDSPNNNNNRTRSTSSQNNSNSNNANTSNKLNEIIKSAAVGSGSSSSNSNRQQGNAGGGGGGQVQGDQPPQHLSRSSGNNNENGGGGSENSGNCLRDYKSTLLISLSSLLMTVSIFTKTNC